MLEFIDRLYWKHFSALAKERTKLEIEQYWSAVARNVAPSSIKEHHSGRYVLINGEKFIRTVIFGIPPSDRINGYPKDMGESLISRLMDLSTRGNQLTISHKIIPLEYSESIKMINTSNFVNAVNQEDSKKEHDRQSDGKVTDLTDEGLKIERKHNKDNFEAIVVNNEKHYSDALVVTLKSYSEDGLNALESDVRLIVGSEGVEYMFPDFRHKQTYLSALPFNITPEYSQVQVLAPYAAVLTPSRNPNSRTDKQGLFFGYDRFTNKTIMVDINAMAAQHMLGIGPTGSGKTFTLLLLLLRARSMLNRRVIYCTPKADTITNHRAVVDYLGDTAELVDIGPNGHNINPMQILYDRAQMGNDKNEYVNAYNNHKGIITKFLDVWFEDTGSINMNNFIDYSLNEVYKNAGIYRDIPSTWHDAKWPVLNDLISFWQSKLNGADLEDRKTIKAVLNKTFSLGEHGVLEYMNKPTDIDLSKDFIIIDLSDTPDMIKDAMNVLITGIMGQRFRTDTEKQTIIAIDEARVFLQNPMLSKFLLTTLTQGRSANIALWLLTQQATDLKKGNVAEEFQTNIFLKMILGNNLTKDNVKHVIDYFNLDSTDTENLLSSGVGEGLLCIGDNKTPIEFKPTQLEMYIIKGKYITNDKKELVPELSELDERLIDLVMSQGFCLDSWAPNSTLVQGWVREPVANVWGQGMITAWVRTKALPSNQSLDHFSSVVQIAAKLILSGATDVIVNHFDDADISFIMNDVTHCIEYERIDSHTEEEIKEKKFRMQSIYSKVIFVCASTYHKRLVSWIGDDFVVKRGRKLLDFIEAIQ